MSPVRFAILGFGRHASFRLVPAFAASREVTLTGLWRRNPEQAAAAAAQHSLRAYPTPEALCASPDVDAVFIASPDALHLAHAQLAFAHGKAVLCEKPLAMTAAEAESMLAAANTARALFGVAHNFRSNASVQHIRERILAGDIGTPRTAHAEFNYAADRSPRTWIADPSLACGGPIGDVGVHCIDTLRFLLDANAETVSTIATQDAHSGNLEASASLQLQLTRNILAAVNVSARAAYRTVVEIVGSDGTLVSENCLTVDRPVDVQLRKGGELIDTHTFSNADGYTRMLDNFARALRGTEAFLAPGSEGVTNQHVLEAAYRSWHTGQRERVS